MKVRKENIVDKMLLQNLNRGYMCVCMWDKKEWWISPWGWNGSKQTHKKQKEIMCRLNDSMVRTYTYTYAQSAQCVHIHTHTHTYTHVHNHTKWIGKIEPGRYSWTKSNRRMVVHIFMWNIIKLSHIIKFVERFIN